ncbi:DUF5677 domain-containing protein [Novosphingobium album (ex Hu et al. 2023)]|uniref:HEPN AbiU2-like domain-containing protein n=1 Tax=Novosphingobium album (ex Hu et al. 2023) TaxID=2930093 RepID=A0ABT0B2F0_9SPHN|nr:DUF5677 domain-containing protein [Novosphingobium album (ex Hu et al. 2023)]MCJ2179085.1 hypothetical protein [Novosphingobium album (ex Hu et al. 2023)]
MTGWTLRGWLKSLLSTRKRAFRTADKAIGTLKGCLFKALDLGSLHFRNPTAHKWKAPYRSMQLREVVHWRMTDLLDQAVVLQKHDHVLGARILLRSAFETLAMLIYLNQQMTKVLDGTLSFHAFSRKTEVLLLSSKDGSTPLSAINVLTILDDCDKRYKGIRKMYGRLSESAHPNYSGMSKGYTEIDHERDTVLFKNRWSEMYAANFEDEVMLCVEIFTHEYDQIWAELFEQLEEWIEAQDATLEATKNDALPK